MSRMLLSLIPFGHKVSLCGQSCWHLCQEEGIGCPRLIPQTASVNFREGYVTKDGTRNNVWQGVGG